jgi:hypothetical protein
VLKCGPAWFMGTDSTTPDVQRWLQGESLKHLRQFCRATAVSFQEARKIAVASHDNSQKLMVWLGGLMGAGTLSSYGLLIQAPPATRLMVLLPWIAGIFSATLCTVLGGEVAERNGQRHFMRHSLLKLLQIQDDRERIIKSLPSILDPTIVANDPESVALNRWTNAAEVTFYLAHILFMMGIAAAATSLIVPWKP